MGSEHDLGDKNDKNEKDKKDERDEKDEKGVSWVRFNGETPALIKAEQSIEKRSHLTELSRLNPRSSLVVPNMAYYTSIGLQSSSNRTNISCCYCYSAL